MVVTATGTAVDSIIMEANLSAKAERKISLILMLVVVSDRTNPG
jgi:hypothetical protein